MKTVLCDIDCVVADLLGPWLSAYNSEYAQDISIKDVSSWDLGKCVPDGDDVYKIIRRPGFFASLPLLDGAAEGLEKLLCRHEVYLVSAAYSASAFSEKFDWVRKHLPFMKDRVFLTDGKTPKGLIRGDVLIDDGPHNLIDFKERNPSGTAIAAYYPYTHPAGHVLDYLVPFADPQWPSCGPAWGWKTIVDILSEGQ